MILCSTPRGALERIRYNLKIIWPCGGVRRFLSFLNSAVDFIYQEPPAGYRLACVWMKFVMKK
jgi:hypothetical protein